MKTIIREAVDRNNWDFASAWLFGEGVDLTEVRVDPYGKINKVLVEIVSKEISDSFEKEIKESKKVQHTTPFIESWTYVKELAGFVVMTIVTVWFEEKKWDYIYVFLLDDFGKARVLQKTKEGEVCI